MRDRLLDLVKEGIIEHYSEDKNCSEYETIADDLIENGVIVPPCKVGDTVYVKYYGEIVNAYVTEFEINSKGIVAKVYIDPDTDREYDAEDVFLTRKEAVQALKGGGTDA